jgi:CRP-like cAMP-binding protein
MRRFVLPQQQTPAAPEPEPALADEAPDGPAAEPFGMFPPHVAALLSRSAVHRCWHEGEVVLPADRVVPWVLTVRRGKLRMAATLEDGRDCFFRWHAVGEVAGLISAVSDLPLPVDAVAFEHCETLHVERELLLDLMQRDGEASLAVARLIARHAYDTVNLVRMIHESSLNGRVLGVLRHLAEVNGRPEAPGLRSLPVSQHDIAAALGASRQRVNAELRALERAGQIRLGYNRVLLVEAERGKEPH